MLRWAIELGRIIIAFEVSYLSRYIGFPRTRYLEQILHVFNYLEIHNVNVITLGLCYQRVTSDKNIQIKVQVVKDLYVDDGEEIPPNDPKPKVKQVQVNCFIDSDHAVDRETCISQTGIIIYCN